MLNLDILWWHMDHIVYSIVQALMQDKLRAEALNRAMLLFSIVIIWCFKQFCIFDTGIGFSTFGTIFLVITGNLSLWANFKNASVENLPFIFGQVRHNTLSLHRFCFYYCSVYCEFIFNLWKVYLLNMINKHHLKTKMLIKHLSGVLVATVAVDFNIY